MNKGELIEAVAKVTSTKKEAQMAVDILLDSIKKALKKKNPVAIAGFGTFKVKERKARTGRNPKTGETIKIPAKKVVSFKPAKDLKTLWK